MVSYSRRQGWCVDDLCRARGRAARRDRLSTFLGAETRRPGSACADSPDPEERLEAKLNALFEQSGLDPPEIEATLPAKHRKR